MQTLFCAAPGVVCRSYGNHLDKVYNCELPNRVLFYFQMMKHAWDNYVRYAWGKNELRPLSKRGHSASIFGTMPLGATILDGLDTLLIMGLDEEYKQGRDWIANELDIETMVSLVSNTLLYLSFIGRYLLILYAIIVTGHILCAIILFDIDLNI